MKIRKEVITTTYEYVELTQLQEFYLRVEMAKNRSGYHANMRDTCLDVDVIDDGTKLNKEQRDFINSISTVKKGDKLILTNDYNLGHGTTNSDELKCLTEGFVYTAQEDEKDGACGSLVKVKNDNGVVVTTLKRRFDKTFYHSMIVK